MVKALSPAFMKQKWGWSRGTLGREDENESTELHFWLAQILVSGQLKAWGKNTIFKCRQISRRAKLKLRRKGRTESIDVRLLIMETISFPVKNTQRKQNSRWLDMNFSKSSHLWVVKKIKVSQQKRMEKSTLLGLPPNSLMRNKGDVVLNCTPRAGISPQERQNLPGHCIRRWWLARPIPFYLFLDSWEARDLDADLVPHIRQTCGRSGRWNWGRSSRLPVPEQLFPMASDKILGGWATLHSISLSPSSFPGL